MTASVGFDKFWDQGGGNFWLEPQIFLAGADRILAVTPDVAADVLIKFIKTFDMKSTGEYWAPRGAG